MVSCCANPGCGKPLTIYATAGSMFSTLPLRAARRDDEASNGASSTTGFAVAAPRVLILSQDTQGWIHVHAPARRNLRAPVDDFAPVRSDLMAS